ncbi:hypothetical protein GALMADRAFT_81451 [Galerina marginata CBS 339.88]|uniref:Uncharacterized protein n=1 Tax=Galerina marginata (strain CBS 339.88) TaxID=685588 RepID=A0A067S4P5_GALM3|nr:hypothetical protein GALMADRAFT_81451 [Galerina marginata CBS 339.88]
MSLSWTDFIGLVTKHKSDAFELDAEINLEELLEDIRVTEHQKIAREIANVLWNATGYRFIYKKCQKSRTSDSIKTFGFFCAQLRGEETKQKLHKNEKKRRARMTMDRFDCSGRLRITMVDGNPKLAGITIIHHRPHCHYVDISLTDKVDTIIQNMVNLPASKVSFSEIFYAWDSILAQNEQGELTEKQVYARWAELTRRNGDWTTIKSHLPSNY